MSEKIRFANQLRGLAALSVVISHWIGVYWLVQDAVSAVTFSPAPAGPPPEIVDWVNLQWFNFGPFGVGVFFLISGFVIPFSLQKHTRLSFAAARLLRIFPTYIAAFMIEMAVIYTASLFWGRPFTYGWALLMSNALLFYDVIGAASLDLVNWTLSVELKFYGLAMLLLPAIRRGNTAALIAVGALAVALNALMREGWVGDIAAAPSTVSYTVSSHSVCLTYMLIGVAFSFHLRRLLSTEGLLLTVAVLLGQFLAAWNLSVWRDQFPVVTVNYLYAVALFGILYAVRGRVPANAALDALASISFPLYLVHSLLGYSLFRALMTGAGLSYGMAVAITLPSILLVCAVLHWTIERPSVRLGQRLGQNYPQPGVELAAVHSQ